MRIYSTMNYANDRPYDLGHPRHLDQIAMDFPELRIVAGLSGWPWVPDLVGLMRRHPNLYCDTAAHHPHYFGVPALAGLGESDESASAMTEAMQLWPDNPRLTGVRANLVHDADLAALAIAHRSVCSGGSRAMPKG